MTGTSCMHAYVATIHEHFFFILKKTYCTFQKNINAFLSVWKYQTKQEDRD